MIRLVIILGTFVVSVLANGQTTYESDMQKALELFDNGNLEDAGNLFEKIAETEQNNWLPNYYVALTNSLQSFTVSEKDQKENLLEKAEKFLKTIAEKQPDNVEIMVVQALIDTGWIVYDPMTYGQRNFNKILAIYAKARRIDPQNPRVALSSVEFDMNSTKYMGGNPKDFCNDLKKVTELFVTFKPETEFHPNWGAERIEILLRECNL